MEKINTIGSLIRALIGKNSHEDKVLDMMRRIDIPREEFEKYYSWDDDRYARNVLARTDEIEILLICWEKGQSSPIHDFNSQEAWIHPIEGWIKEERFKINPGDDTKLERISSVLLGTDEYAYMNQVGIHRYSNSNNARSVTLNVYARPVTEWRVYDEETTNSTVTQTWENKNFNLQELSH
ncbi:MAG: cysteine dioxygenase family protein [Cyclobacteriaceae bacterium]